MKPLFLLCAIICAVTANAQSIRVSIAPGLAPANGDSRSASVNADGSNIAFESVATDLVSNDSNGLRDIFVHTQDSLQMGSTDPNNATRTTERVSVASDESEANGSSSAPQINGCFNCFDANGASLNGRYVVFVSSATNLVSGDTNGVDDIFLRDRSAGTTELISANSDGLGQITSLADGASAEPRISADGCQVLFSSLATNLAASIVAETGTSTTTNTTGKRQIYLYRSQRSSCNNVSLVLEFASASSSGTLGNGDSFSPSLGRFKIAFASAADNLISSDLGGTTDIFVRHLSTGNPEGTIRATILASKSTSGIQANGASANPSIAPSDNQVAFDSTADNLVAGDSEGFRDVFVHNIGSGETVRVSQELATGIGGDGESARPHMSDGAAYVAFETDASNLDEVPDCNGARDIFVYNFPFTSMMGNSVAAAMRRASVTPGGFQANAGCTGAQVSPDGFLVVYESIANNLVFDFEPTQIGTTHIFGSVASENPDDLSSTTELREPPDVCVTGKSASFRFQNFSSGTESAAAASTEEAKKNGAACDAELCYTVRVKTTKGKKAGKIITKTVDRNTAALSKLPPGTYSVKYKVRGSPNGQPSVKTPFSPTNTFKIKPK